MVFDACVSFFAHFLWASEVPEHSVHYMSAPTDLTRGAADSHAICISKIQFDVAEKITRSFVCSAVSTVAGNFLFEVVQ
jgi:hypothetical protein